MAGRNRKKSADYFSHDADASTDEKLVYLESKFGHTGYALYFKFLERMARSDDFMLDWNDIKKSIYASEFNVSVTEIDDFVTECCRDEIKAFRIEGEKIFSAGFVERMRPLIEKREYNREKYEAKKRKRNNGLNNSATEKDISATELTQKSRVEKSREYKRIADSKESASLGYKTKKKKNLTGKRLETFEKFWEAFDFKRGKAAAADAWLEIPALTDVLVSQICAAAEKEAAARPGLEANGGSPKWAQGWITERRWEDECYSEPKPAPINNTSVEDLLK